MRRAIPLVLAALFSALLPTPAQSAAEIPSTFTFGGAGWGHGVGLSQYGALGMAREGKTETEILGHYYPTTSVAAVRDDMDIRVNLLNQVTSAVIRVSGTADSVMQVLTGDVKEPNAAPLASMNNTQTLNLALDGSNVLASISSKEVTTRLEPSSIFTIRWSGTRFLDGVDAWARVGTNASAPLYRYGQIVVRTVKTATGTALVVNNDVRIHDEYLRGLAEMPSSWPVPALKAQAIAARSYALSRFGNGKLTTSCGCHIYSSTQDQRFAGWAKEAEANWGARWAGAVAETAADPLTGFAVVADGKPITAYFFSSSGGRTQDVSEVWSSRIRWLVSVPDPWSLDRAVNPTYASWTRTVTQAAMAKAFGLADVVSVSFPLRTAGGGIKSAIGQSSTGQSVTLTGEVFRSRTALPSTYLMRAIERIDGTTSASLAVAVNKASRTSNAGAVISDDGDRDLRGALAAIALADQNSQPHLLVSDGALPKGTLEELKRRKITSVTLVGAALAIPKSIVDALKSTGIKATRTSAETIESTLMTQRTGDPILASVLDQELVASIAGLAARDDRPLILMAPEGLNEASRSALAAMSGRPITVIGRRISIPRAILDEISLTNANVIDLRTGDGEQLLIDAAGAFDSLGIRVLIVSDLSTAIAASSLQQTILWLSPGQALPDWLTLWIRERPRLVQVTVVGSTLGKEMLGALRSLN